MLLERISQKATQYLVKEQAADTDRAEVIQYGLQSLISTGLAATVLIILSLVFGLFFETLVFLGIFILLRKYTGGYHAGTYLRCFVTTIAAYVLNVVLSRAIQAHSGWFLPTIIALCVMSCVPIFLFSPHENANHPLTERERGRYGRFSRLGAVLAVAVVALCMVVQARQFALFACMALVTTAATLVVGVLHDRYRKKMKSSAESPVEE